MILFQRTPDGDFIIDRHPKYPNILIGAGGSGTAERPLIKHHVEERKGGREKDRKRERHTER